MSAERSADVVRCATMSDLTPREPHRAELRLRLGKRARLDAWVTIGSRGLLAIGGLVSSILLSSAVIVVAAKRSRPDVP